MLFLLILNHQLTFSLYFSQLFLKYSPLQVFGPFLMFWEELKVLLNWQLLYQKLLELTKLQWLNLPNASRKDYQIHNLHCIKDVWFFILMLIAIDLRANNHKDAHLKGLIFIPIISLFYLPFWKLFLFIELQVQTIYAFKLKIVWFLLQFQNLIKEPN